jgi:Flp pilus assembly protein TadD
MKRPQVAGSIGSRLLLVSILSIGSMLSMEASAFAETPPPPDETDQLDQLDLSDLPEIPDEDLLTLRPKIAKFLVKHVPAGRARQVRLRFLIDSLFDKDGLGIKYGNTHTKTAAETFDTKSGNCLSFTLLFVSMARHVGLRAYFMEVAEVTSWNQRGEFVLNNHHMFAEVELDNGVMQVDFLPGEEKRYYNVRRITDRRAEAHFYNNLGVEKLAAEDVRGALAYFYKALDREEDFSPTWTNLGVAFRELGAFERAEESYLKAIDLGGVEAAPMANLASLYLSRGMVDQAAPYLDRVADRLRKNPFHHYRLAMNAARVGRTAEAVEHLEEAIRRLPRDGEFHAALAELQLELGDVDAARLSLERAVRLTVEDERKDALNQKLTALPPSAVLNAEGGG